MNFKLSAVFISAAISFLSTLAPATSVEASIFERGKNVVISNVHVVDDDLYIYSSDFRMEGTVNGDLSVFAYESKIQGQVSRAINVFARSNSFVGRCEGPFRSFSETLSMDGVVAGSATVIGRQISFNKGAVIERDFVVRGSDVNIDGTLKGKLDVKGGDVTITGQIGGDVTISCTRLLIKPPAVISGNLTFECDGEPQIDSSGVTIVGTVKRATPKVVAESDTNLIRTIAMRLSGLCAAFLFGLILVRLFPSYARASYQQLTNRFATSLAAGFLVMGVIVACAIVLVMTLITGIAGQVLFSSGQTGTVFGIVLTVFAILMLPISSFSAVSGVILFYGGKVFIALFIGALLLKKKSAPDELPGGAAMFIGLLILTFLFWIPYGGALIYLFVAALGAGAIVLGVRDCRKSLSASNSSAPGDSAR